MGREIPGFETIEQLYDSATTRVWRARSLETNARVVLKYLKSKRKLALARYRNERELGRVLDFEGAAAARDMIAHAGSWVLVFDDVGARSLADVLVRSGPLPCRDVLAIAIRLADQLHELHARNVIHKDISPGNVIWNRELGDVRIIDYGISVLTDRENPGFGDPSQIVGTLAYIAPEQTGRMNRTLDYRADFYGLGATLYEALTGRPPFTADDPLELVHSHLARPPVPPRERDPSIPDMVSRIVMALLAKTPEERYQSARGLRVDLVTCQRELRDQGAVSAFALRQRDVAPTLQVSERLYGRRTAIRQLLTAFGHAADGGRALALVAGPPGIGKTSVVQELYPPITARRGSFLHGKHDQLRRDEPYHALAPGFGGLLRQLLTEDEQALAVWRERLARAVTPNGRLIADIIPELEQVIGAQPEVPPVGEAQAQARFASTFQQFVRALCSREHPLVLFLDDMQWADAATLAVLEVLLTDRELGHLLVIGAYRDDQLDAGSATVALAALERASREGRAATSHHRIELEPLRVAEVAQLCADSLRLDRDSAWALAFTVVDKTGGNPFFVRQFLGVLVDRKLLWFDHDAGSWRWDDAAIRAEQITDNVADLLLARLHGLPDETQSALRVAAFLGVRFAVASISAALDRSTADTYRVLRPALDSGVLVQIVRRPSGEPGDPVDPAEPAEPVVVEAFRFAHDRLQQAAYELTDEDARPRMHLQVGRALKAQAGAGHQPLFQAVGHLNQARAVIEEADERRELAELNAQAGERALASQAVDAAAGYFGHAMADLGEAAWRERPAFARRVTIGAAQAELRRGDIAAAEALLTGMLAATDDRLAQAAADALLIQAATLQSRFHDAHARVTTALARFDVELPGDGEAVGALIGNTLAALGDRPAGELASLPAAEDAETLAILRLLGSFTSAALFLGEHTFLGNGLQMARIMLERGVHGIGAFGFGILGSALQMAGDVARGAEAGRAAIELAARFGVSDQVATTCVHYGASLSGWVEHARIADAVYERGAAAGTAGGVPHTACYNLVSRVHNRLFQGVGLQELWEDANAVRALAGEQADAAAVDTARGLAMVIANLTGRTRGGLAFDAPDGDGGARDEAEILAEWERNGSHYGTGLYLCYRGFAQLLAGHPREALATAERAIAMLPFLAGHIAGSLVPLVAALALAAEIPGLSGAERRRARVRLDAFCEQIEEFSANCPDNFAHFAALVVAETARADGDWAQALAGYERAIANARAHGFAHHEALAHDRLGTLWLDQDRPHYARPHLDAAVTACARWGAAGVAARMRERHESALEAALARAAASGTAPLSEPGGASGAGPGELATTREAPGLDLMTVVKASQSIGGEIVLDRLLRTLLRVVFECAGAESGALFLRREGQLVAIAAGEANAPERFRVGEPVPLASWNDGARSVVNYAARTGEAVILGRAAAHERYRLDGYVARVRPRSILCLPLRTKGETTGILYLENNLAFDAFSPDRCQVLELIAGQMAVSLDNAHLYAELGRALAEARESERLKSEFLATVSHELRTPLNAIINIPELVLAGMVTTAVANCPACGQESHLGSEAGVAARAVCPGCGQPGLTERTELELGMPVDELAPLLEAVLRSGRHLLALVSGILDLSHLESGFARLAVEPVDLERLFREVEGDMRPLADERGIALEFAVVEPVEPARGATLRADPVKLRQILTNLIDNALKFSPGGARVAVTAQTTERGTWTLSVADTGPGIAEAEQRVIFDRFRQGDPRVTRRHGGVGLGLAIVRKLCELHGGTIRVEAAPGAGSTFIAELPSAGPSG